MVRWFAPRQLWTTAVQIFGAKVRGDYRIIESLEAEQPAFDHAGDGDMWIDYVADMGDGFDSAFGVARQIARERIDVTGAGRPLPGGRILIMGGDECYPVASREGYRRRLTLPYQNAFTGPDERSLYVLPGNHDWYDGLTAFMRRFCQQRRLGSLRTRQSRSYFALRLPSDWWLLGIDLQLGADIDRPQSNYFRQHALDHMRDGHRVIVCTAEPGWVNEPDSEEMRNFRFIQEQVHGTGARIHLWLSGDLHHYMRHRPGSTGLAGEAVIAGGGGAFLHPTHVLPAGRPPPVCRYPEAGVSRRLALGNLAFALRNWELGPVIGAIYALLGAAVTTPHGAAETGTPGLHDAFHAGVTALFGHPFALLCAGLVLTACFLVGECGRWYRRVASLVHGLTHVGAAMLTAHLAIHAVAAIDPASMAVTYLATAGFTIAGGAIVGLAITSLYFTVSGLLGRVPNNSFAAMRIVRYKSWVRLHLRGDGGLDLYAIGLDDVPRRWRQAPDAAPGEPRVVPDGRDPPPHLIEKVPIAGPRPGSE